MLLSQLIQLLNQREKKSLLLSDLSALLPAALRQRVKDHGGLREWLQQCPSHGLFKVAGEPGKESVSLCLGIEPTGADTAGAVVPANTDTNQEEEEDIDALSAVQLRGLPYRATVEELVSFLGEHSSHLAERNAVQLVQNRDGRPSGFARVQFTSPASASKCVADLHLRSMDDRYVEVFLYNERPSKGRKGRGSQEDGTTAQGAGESVPPSVAVDTSGVAVTREHVVSEVRAEMGDIQKRRQLLSMLGVALSPPARAYLKQMDQGLKHFLSQFPAEFSVDGGKGCEYVTYAPTQLSLSQALDGFATAGHTKEAPGSAPGRLTASPKARAGQLQASPKSTGGPASGNRGMQTPSDWGTPNPWGAPAAPPWGALPAWPQGAPSGPSDPAAWGALPAWPMADPSAQFAMAGWPQAWPGCAPFPGAPDFAAIASANAAFGAAPQLAPPSPPQLAEVQAPAPVPVPVASSPTVGAIRLRGLPFTSAEQDVLAFFAQHDIVDRISDAAKAVNILTRSNGRPSGQAIVQMNEPGDAELAQGVLHGQWMGSRYIEVFLLTAEENEAQSGQTTTSPAKGSQQEPISLSMGVPAPSPIQAQVPALPSAFVPNAGTGPVQNLDCQLPGMAPAIPPWQLNMWSAMVAGGAPPSAPELGGPGGSEASTWEALFQFLGPESTAAMANGMAAPPLDYSALGYPGYGLPQVPANGMPPAWMAGGAPLPSDLPAAAV